MNNADEQGTVGCRCGRSIAELIEDSFETLVEGYVVCSRCGCRMELDAESGTPLRDALGAALGDLQDGVKKIADDFKPDPDKVDRGCGGRGGCGQQGCSCS